MHRCYWCGLWLGIVLTIWGSIPGVSLTQTIQVAATVETEPVPSKDDAADDPCVWIYPTAPSRSTIIGTDKKEGLPFMISPVTHFSISRMAGLTTWTSVSVSTG